MSQTGSFRIAQLWSPHETLPTKLSHVLAPRSLKDPQGLRTEAGQRQRTEAGLTATRVQISVGCVLAGAPEQKSQPTAL